jgi:DNA polymerase III delta subunit|tara:strand:- start:837 stop:1844 length:1008 start_codon:yes stop_codon:yes gene_type:complete
MSSFSSNSNQLSTALNNFSEGKVEPIYFLMGDDQYLQQFFIKKLQESIDQGNKIDKMMLSVEEIGSKDVINKLNESDIFSSKQLFILRNPNSLRGKTRDELVEYCSNPNSNNYLVLIQDEYGIKNKFIKSLVSFFNPISVSTPFDSELKKWAKLFFKDNGIKKIPNKTIEKIIDIFGESVYGLKNEIDKLCLSIDKEENLENFNYLESAYLTRSYKKFEFFNYLGKRDTRLSVKLGRSLVSKDSSMLDLLRPLNEFFQELLFIKIFSGTNRNSNSYTLLSPSVNRQLPTYANNFTSKEIVTAIKRLAKIDKQIKSSNIDDESAITEFVYATTRHG